MSYTKLFSSIVTSTIWTEDPKICKVWVTMLAIADKHGEVHASIPGLAQIAGMTLADTEAAIQKFLSPDKYSRTPDDEGRRIEKIDDGWLLLNHAKYRAMASKDEEKTSAAKRQAAFRERQKRNGKITACHGSVTGSNAVVTPSRDIADTDSKAEAEAEGEAKADADTKPKRQKRSIDLVGFDAFWRMYPKKVGKSDAVKEWAKLTPEEIEAAERSLPLHLKSVSWLKEGGKYIPHPHRWLNKKRWEDELPAALLSDVQAIETDNDELGFLNNDNAIFHKDRP